jgi:hypothetical protein
MTKIPKMQKNPNIFLLDNRDDQLAYFTMLTPKQTNNIMYYGVVYVTNWEL